MNNLTLSCMHANVSNTADAAMNATLPCMTHMHFFLHAAENDEKVVKDNLLNLKLAREYCASKVSAEKDIELLPLRNEL